MKEDLKINPTLLKLLTDLSKNNVLMGVGTSSYTDRTHKILELLGIKNYFSAISTAEEIHEHKPNPHIFLDVAKKLGAHPKNCIVIEDASVGIEAAKRGNMKVVGYVHSYTTREQLKEANLIIEDFSELSYNVIREILQNQIKY